MNQCLIVGQTNVGKTLFCVNFAEYLGASRLEIAFSDSSGGVVKKKYDPVTARSELAGLGTHKTRCLQSFVVGLPYGKGVKRLQLTDTAGLVDGIHGDPAIRESIAQTIAAIRETPYVLHIVDLTRVAVSGALDELDRQIYRLGSHKNGYVLLANKMDLPAAKDGLYRLRKTLRGSRLIPVSALYRQGFREVKEYVWRWV
jgi:GTPase SAR1 family protein